MSRKLSSNFKENPEINLNQSQSFLRTIQNKSQFFWKLERERQVAEKEGSLWSKKIKNLTFRMQ